MSSEHYKASGFTLPSPWSLPQRMVVLPIEKVRSKDRFILEARESYWITKYSAVKVDEVGVIEHGLNLRP